ncbi:tannase/feruloyl esterase family alpha/beta hydrolase [Sorangium sp. So ce117]|uniref:tannase/feruloyl esterase family alpha/beta hydrolase n=1 Tax=Sorangium sp. So ce117 TaxID=3133277 RepID=UPI003F5EC471
MTIDDAHVVPASDASAEQAALPASCRVLGTSRPTPDSTIRFLVAIPQGPAFNGRFVQVGNGGFAGRIREGSILGMLSAGNAAAGTDGGHSSPDGSDATWALGHPEKVVDFGHRALKETTDAARAIVLAYTGKAPSRSYFFGCSDGGREALMEAQRYPDDFDGIVAIAPANNWTNVFFGGVWAQQALHRDAAHYLSPPKLQVLQAAARKACAASDGVIDNPLDCRFDPAVVQCNGAENDDCLTAAQVETARAIYAGPKNSRTGEPIVAGYEPGYEAEPGSWQQWITGQTADDRSAEWTKFASTFFSNVVFDDPQYDFMKLDFDADLTATQAKVSSILDASDPDLSRFRRRGGKLIQVHGWADPAIPPRNSIRYFESVRAKMGDTADFYRLFMVPGMLHCLGGPGPDDPRAVNPRAIEAALVDWVEGAKVPDELLASTGTNASGATPATRLLCPHPLMAQWDGKGDRGRAESYACVAP